MKVRYTNPALADLNSILSYITTHSPGGAERVQHRIRSAVDLLQMHPGIGVQTVDPDIRR